MRLLLVLATLAGSWLGHGHGPPSASPTPLADGDVFVANLGDHTVARFDGSSGAFLGAFVERGAGGLSSPTGLAFGPDGDLYVSSSGDDRILRFDGQSGEFRGVFAAGPPLRRPFTLIFGPDGALYVSCGVGDVVLRYEAPGATPDTAAFGHGLRQPIGLAFGPRGVLHVVSSGSRAVLRFQPADGSFVGVAAQDSLRFPSDVAFDEDGSLLVTDASAASVVRFDGSLGRFLERAVSLPAGAAPVGIARTASGSFVVGDFAGGRLYLADREGRAIPWAEQGLNRPENIAVRRR